MNIRKILNWLNGMIFGFILSLISIFVKSSHADMSTLQRSVEIISQAKPLDCINDISWFYAIMICIPVIYAICYALLFHLVGGIIRLYVTRIKK